MLSVRFEVVVSLLLAPVGADKRGPKAPFPLVEIVGNTAGDLQESTRRSSGGSQVLLKALQLGYQLNKFRFDVITETLIRLLNTRRLGHSTWLDNSRRFLS